ncbi:DUF937 domain-containing protein [Methylobacterium sp. NEAU 140]|uniref:DUF937 domain-containing protein n=1 Tax=Methylobacterium sp. NEAU 140 TaxID=3064945 RepID=UPI0027354A3A|nr:DUF937 domain-containing protein [Methylobacterium sp. NEAU 140]MDP4023640.1 DUF937 domain-containing protein [Methylobacterium sp. NEAU 140]
MFNPIDMMQVQGGAGTQAMAQQFGLTVEQTQRAMEALMPALTLGLQRGAGLDPIGFARMFMAPDTARSTAPQGLDALGQMFGSAQLMQAVLQQASAASGVGSQVLRQMLPMMAGAVVASIVHVMLNQPQAEPARQPAAPPAPAPFPFAPLWADMARAFLPPSEPQATKPAATRPPQPAPRTAQQPPQIDAPETGSDVLQQMFRTGAEVQEQNIKAMQELFEAFWPKAQPQAETPPAPAAPPPPADAAPQAPPPERPAPRSRRGRSGDGGAG